MRSLRLLGTTIVVAALALTAAGCAAPDAAGGDTASSGDRPRVIEHVAGETEIPAQPENIVSTSITLTGSLLAIGAPVTASAATVPGGGVADDRGFFSQWSDAATEAGVEVLYPDLELDLEAVIAAAPDLIVVSSSGADTTADFYDDLSDIAPTIVLDYGANSWQEVATQLGEATGLEQEAADVVTEFDARAAEVAAAITPPATTANAVVYNGTEFDTAFAKEGGAHATLLESLGFTVEGADDAFDLSEQPRNDFAFVSIENSTVALSAPVAFLVNGTDETAAQLLAEPVFSQAPAVAAGQVYPLGSTSFRIDYYSALQVVDIIEGLFS